MCSQLRRCSCCQAGRHTAHPAQQGPAQRGLAAGLAGWACSGPAQTPPLPLQHSPGVACLCPRLVSTDTWHPIQSSSNSYWPPRQLPCNNTTLGSSAHAMLHSTRMQEARWCMLRRKMLQSASALPVTAPRLPAWRPGGTMSRWGPTLGHHCVLLRGLGGAGGKCLVWLAHSLPRTTSSNCLAWMAMDCTTCRTCCTESLSDKTSIAHKAHPHTCMSCRRGCADAGRGRSVSAQMLCRRSCSRGRLLLRLSRAGSRQPWLSIAAKRARYVDGAVVTREHMAHIIDISSHGLLPLGAARHPILRARAETASACTALLQGHAWTSSLAVGVPTITNLYATIPELAGWQSWVLPCGIEQQAMARLQWNAKRLERT